MTVTLAAERGGEHGGAVTSGRAHPDDRAIRAHQAAALAVGNERILTQDAGCHTSPGAVN